VRDAGIPSGAKAQVYFVADCGTTEVVPFQNFESRNFRLWLKAYSMGRTPGFAGVAVEV
jgi:hypothetical protein